VTEQSRSVRVETPAGGSVVNRVHLLAVAAGTILVRWWFMVAFRVDSDEPQHLHVAWAWTRGLVQYRDVFDNHLPLLHLLLAPIMAVAPQSSEVFLFTRAAMMPVAIACAWLLYVFARPLYGERVAAVAALTFAVAPPWLAKSVEVRNDTLWMFFWLLALVLFLRPEKPSYFWGGVACAFSFLASIKFAPLFIAHLLAFATQRKKIPPVRDLLLFAAGAGIPVAVVAAVFAYLGALDEMLYATLFFNASTPIHPARRIAGVVIFALVATAIFVKGKHAPHLLLFALWYPSVLLAFWPILTPRDFLPLIPLFTLWVASRWRGAVLVPVVVAIIWSYVDARLWRGPDPSRGEFIDATMRITDPNDYVLDLKGDAVFRRRPIYYIYEDVGRALTEKGALPDHGPERAVATGCCVAIRDTPHLPPRTRAFLQRYFIGEGLLRVCGARPSGSTFEIGVPQTYAVVGGGRVTIDGTPYSGPRRLEAGTHTIASERPATVVWARAAKEWE
jgi:Dolichyl-phosphate-mannose-protein mannosyltransferase